MQEDQRKYKAKAFVSCSLRKDDKQFVDLVSNILLHFQILPFGTVGLYDASSDNPVDLMKRNIEEADFVVIAATKRYLTKDHHSGKESNQISEMIHTEAGMAFANSKPVVVFVEDGTNVGNFLPSITQYITLDGTQENLNRQLPLITSLIDDSYQKSQEVKNKKSLHGLGQLLMGGLAIYGGLKLLVNNDDDDEFDDDDFEDYEYED